ncbi:hypothetical protein F2Q69_00021424 [Brassica cretica]|uniref:Uncharacterized protein n=1 Tax=Brassica cretica TaxID=69181 RepID=A0A8S9QE38_BRACR|nr:hypothetical protein F2Q69_00021424 [Brassica cretica]
MSIDRHCLLPIDRHWSRPCTEGDYSIGSWENDHHHECEPGVDEPHEGFTYEELLNVQRRDETEQYRAEATGEKHISATIPTEPTVRQSTETLRHRSTSVRNHHTLDPDGYARAIDGHALQVSREEIVDILQMANGADNLFAQQCTVPAHQQRVTKEFYDTAGGIDNHFKQKYRHPTRPLIDVDVHLSIDKRPEFGTRALDLFGTRKFYWEEKDEYGVYRDDRGYARDVDGHIINVSKG